MNSREIQQQLKTITDLLERVVEAQATTTQQMAELTKIIAQFGQAHSVSYAEIGEAHATVSKTVIESLRLSTRSATIINSLVAYVASDRMQRDGVGEIPEIGETDGLPDGATNQTEDKKPN